jgi:hypothetical protein
MMRALVTVVLFVSRYFMIAGIAMLALAFTRSEVTSGANFDLEQVLPIVIRDFLPAGLAGLLISGLLAAFMSTFQARSTRPRRISSMMFIKGIYVRKRVTAITYARAMPLPFSWSLSDAPLDISRPAYTRLPIGSSLHSGAATRRRISSNGTGGGSIDEAFFTA